MIINGRGIAADICARAKARVEALGWIPRITAVVTSESSATKSYLAIKAKRASDAGCELEVVYLSDTTSTAELRSAVLAATGDSIIVQLPLPCGVDTQAICDAIPLSKDADVLSRSAREKFERGDADVVPPPVVAAVREIFQRHDVRTKGRKAVVIGAGFLVGAPVATWLGQQGMQVSILTSASQNFGEALQTADIIVSGAGVPHLITPDLLKEGVVLIDAGTSESNGEVAGDADPACAEKCSLFTPVPGGVGPIAVACLFENAAILAERVTRSEH